MTSEGGYYHARKEFVEALFNNPKALETLQKMYHLPELYASINPGRTVRALEMIGVFSSENPEGLIELSFRLDMKDANKKIKRMLKAKKGTTFRFKGYNELHVNADIRYIVASMQATGRYFQAEVELLRSILETRAAQGGDMSAIKVIPLITDLVKEVNDTITGLRRLANELSNTNNTESEKGFEHSHPHMPAVPPKQPTTTTRMGGSDPLRRRPIQPVPYQGNDGHPTQRQHPFPNNSPLLSSSSPRIIEREARKLHDMNKRHHPQHHVPIVLAEDNPYQILPNRSNNISSSQTFDNFLSGRPNRSETAPIDFHTPQMPSRFPPTTQHYNNTPPQLISPLEYDDTVSHSTIPPQYEDIVHNNNKPMLPPRVEGSATELTNRPLPMLPLRGGQTTGNLTQQGTTGQPATGFTNRPLPMLPPKRPDPAQQVPSQQNPFQPRPFATQEQNQFDHHRRGQLNTAVETTHHRPPPPIPLPYNTSHSEVPSIAVLPTSPTTKSNARGSINSYVEMHPATALLKESTSTSSVQSSGGYQHLRHSRMEQKDSYVNISEAGIDSPTVKRDPSYININPVIDTLRDEEGDLVQEEYDTFGNMSATNPFYNSNR